jgi:hypothetical protein
MGSNYKKIEFESEGNYASTEKHWLYIESCRTNDCVRVYHEDGELMFSFCEWGTFDMGKALVTAFTNWNDERMKDVTIEEIKKLKRK